MEVPSAQPGDGICPTHIQCENTATASYKQWAELLSAAKKTIDDFQMADGLLDLIECIPELNSHDFKSFSILDQPYPRLQYALKWLTTTDPACKRPTKCTNHYLEIGTLQTPAYECSDLSGNVSRWSGLPPDQMKHLSRLILAWAYILSARWVETLSAAGEKVAMAQNEVIDESTFWEVVIERQWRATIIRDGKTFYAPWCTTRYITSSEYDFPYVNTISLG